MLPNKKYFSITEVENITKLPVYTLRYIEKTDKNFAVTHIRSRRYYTKSNIEYLLNQYCSHQSQENHIRTLDNHDMILSKINDLIEKFTILTKQIHNH